MRNTPNTVNTASSDARSRFTPLFLEPERFNSQLSFTGESFEVCHMVVHSTLERSMGRERLQIFT